MRDQFLIEQNTDVKAVLMRIDDTWMEPQPKYVTRVSLDFLRNEDAALEILNNIRRRLSKKSKIKSRLAGKIDKSYLVEREESTHAFNHQEVMNAFMAQGTDLFSFVWNYSFHTATDEESRLVLFLQLVSQYIDRLQITSEVRQTKKYEYPIIYPL